MTDVISVGLLGLGTVGCGVARIIEDHQEELEHQTGCAIRIKKALVQHLDKERDVKLDPDLLTNHAEEVIFDPEIDVIVEVMGGIEQTREYVLDALRQKKHVVTANKDLIALHGAELLQAAQENGCDLYYEASVAGGIPILRSLVEGLASDRILKIMGIVNGTTNYILTKMSKEGAAYEEALREAQKLGYAEADPTADVEGLDAARKMAILSTLGFLTNVELDDVSVQGISQVTAEDIAYCAKLGYTMKLIGIAQRDEGRIEVSVQPTLLPHDHPLAAVSNEYNAVYVYGESVGQTMFYGPGAGQLPTATAVVSDLVTVVKHMRLGVSGRSMVAPLYPKHLKTKEEILSKYFLRLHVKDQTGAFATITSLFSEHGVSLERVLQLPLKEAGLAEVVIMTHQTNKKAFDEVCQALECLEVIQAVKSRYRVEGES
ncbi:homoserine dehydrogenase [Caldalkalibacillus uzonensis]|uniref:Homoserine dehydrogenase n=1 Tax=Caldalkalibacillus uzonensis TaxID=353224 RepID=A0ABU0CVL3_9BACI|nr:homoserine dehydrogenase [Caldalkalibacillus uzonensis]MDQ0340465.1 homoserine dehydrogenase [Caldalkalibacillus uzonensis]